MLDFINPYELAAKGQQYVIVMEQSCPAGFGWLVIVYEPKRDAKCPYYLKGNLTRQEAVKHAAEVFADPRYYPPVLIDRVWTFY